MTDDEDNNKKPPLNRDQLKRWLPFLSWPRPDRALLLNEASAGVTVALMVIPQGVAYAALAGMPLVTGIYAALFPALIAVLFSSSARLSVGPTALTSVLVGMPEGLAMQRPVALTTEPSAQ